MKSIFLYKIRHAGSCVDSYSCDLEYIQEMSRQGHIISCKKYFEIGAGEK